MNPLKRPNRLRALLAAAVLTSAAGIAQPTPPALLSAATAATTITTAAAAATVKAATPTPDNVIPGIPASRIPSVYPQNYPYSIAAANGDGALTSRDSILDLINKAGDIEALGENAVGEQVNLSSGSLSFSHRDIVLRGTGPDIVVSRSYDVDSRRNVGWWPQEAFADWALDLPQLTTNVVNLYPIMRPGELAELWRVKGSNPLSRCSNFGEPPPFSTPYFTPPIDAQWWWNGVQLNVPGMASQTLLTRDPAFTAAPTQAIFGTTGTFPIVTKGNWAFTCLPTTRNGAPGEGFLGVAPNGDKYWFDYLATPLYSEQYHVVPNWIDLNSGAAAVGAYGWTHQARLLVSRIEDRYGNAVTYTYTGNDLQSIIASDGRRVDFYWTTSQYGVSQINKIVVPSSSQPGTNREYLYRYTNNATFASALLESVELPDHSRWLFDLKQLIWSCQYRDPEDESAPFTCPPADQPLDFRTLSGSVTAPTGLKATFTLKQNYIGREVGYPSCTTSYFHPMEPCGLLASQVTEKHYVGAGIDEIWKYGYAYTTAVLTDPDDNKTGYVVVNSSVSPQDGQTVSTYFGATIPVLDNPLTWTAKRKVTALIAPDGTLPYVAKLGTAPQAHVNRATEERFNPIKLRRIEQDGVTFTNEVLTYDAFARPLKVQRGNSLGSQRSETTSYADHLPSWTLGQIDTVSDTGSGLVMTDNSYDGAGNLVGTHSFGLDGKSYGYYPNGSLRTVTDADGRTTTLSDYRFNIPRQIDSQPSATQTETDRFTVDDFGRVTSSTDANGYSTSYGYDAMNRLNSLSYPANDSVAWNATTSPFLRAGAAAYGLPAGHWQKTVSTGTSRRVTYFDARWRPVLAREYDTAVAGSDRFVVSRYDASNRKVFESYPLRTLVSIGDTSLPGTTYAFDALGRVTQSTATSELGAPVITTSVYQPGFKTQVTSPHQVTTTSYQLFDEPDYSRPVRIDLTYPNAAYTQLTRDTFGKITAIERNATNPGGGKQAVLIRRFVYDANQRLCKTIDPESGATIVDYFKAGMQRWRAAGLALTSPTSCDRESVTPAQKTVRDYDGRGRLKLTTFGDGSPSIATDYYPDGLPRTISSGTTLWTYGYNKRRLPETEILEVDGRTFGLTRTFDANGFESTLTYPDGETVDFAPDALGLAHKAGEYATGANYNEFRALTGFTYGNGIVHSMTPNVRGLVDVAKDSGLIFDDYAYDEEGNVVRIDDRLDGTNTRVMSYDARGRLLTAQADGLWGMASYTYDPLDNLRTSTIGVRAFVHDYLLSTNRLTALKTAGSLSSTVYAYEYDTRGNVTRRGTQQFAFDQASRLTQAVGTEVYAYDGLNRRVSTGPTGGSIRRYTVYDKGGRLMHEAAPDGSTTNYIYLHGSLVARSKTSLASSLGTPALSSGYAGAINLTGAYCLRSTPVADATRYEFEERSGSGAWTPLGGVTIQSWCATAKPDGTYLYRARACNTQGCGGYSAIETVVVQILDPLPAPTITAYPAGTNTTGNIELRLLMPGMTVAPATTGDLSFVIQEQIGGGAWSDAVRATRSWNNLIPPRTNGTYGYRAMACAGESAQRCGPYGAAITVQVAIPSVPALPATIQSTENPSTDGSYRVSWSSVADATSYRLQEKKNGGSWTTVQDRATNYWDISGRGDSDYAYQVTACNALGCNSGYRGGLSVHVQLAPQVPAAPASITATPSTTVTGRIAVSWSTVNGATSYKLQEMRPNESWVYVDENLSTGFRQLDGRGPGLHKYRAQACNSSGCGSFSAEASATLIGPPATVAWVVAEPALSVDGSFRIRWAQSPQAAFYWMEERVGSNGTWNFLPPDMFGPDSAQFAGRGDGTYYYRVSACLSANNRVLCSAPSALASVRVARPNTVEPPDYIRGPAGSLRPDTIYNLFWSLVSGATRYEIEESNDVTNDTSVMTAYGDAMQLHRGLLRAGSQFVDPTTYSYKVRACNDSTCSAWRGTATACMSREMGWAALVRTPYYVHSDGLGSVVAETDAERDIVRRARYEPYGAPADGNYAPGPGYAGHVTDANTQLTYMQQRYYDPIAARFLSTDPDPVNDTGSNFNRYAYAGNNPYRYVDPDGRQFREFNWENRMLGITPPPRSPDDWLGPALGFGLGTMMAPAAAWGATTLGAAGYSAALSNLPAVHTAAATVADIVAGDAIGGGTYGVLAYSAVKAAKNAEILTDLTGFRWEHILSRHEFGRGISGKTEFPKSWSGADILHQVSDVATDPTLSRQSSKWGDFVIGTRDGVDIQVYFYPWNHPQTPGAISTAFPINLAPNP